MLNRRPVEPEARVTAGERGGKSIEIIIRDVVTGRRKLENAPASANGLAPGLEALAAGGHKLLFGEPAAIGEDAAAKQRLDAGALGRCRFERRETGSCSKNLPFGGEHQSGLPEAGERRLDEVRSFEPAAEIGDDGFNAAAFLAGKSYGTPELPEPFGEGGLGLPAHEDATGEGAGKRDSRSGGAGNGYPENG